VEAVDVAEAELLGAEAGRRAGAAPDPAAVALHGHAVPAEELVVAELLLEDGPPGGAVVVLDGVGGGVGVVVAQVLVHPGQLGAGGTRRWRSGPWRGWCRSGHGRSGSSWAER